ncbi:hypothetical protein CcaCcLH18_11848 [Colletotrichum camelliae]|nr:hypothetical protein CcaCcLH18_11848 [Colletotrichum camelliae]
MKAVETATENTLAVWDLPVEVLQQIACLLDSRDHLHWALASRWFSSVLCPRLVPNAVAQDKAGHAFTWACKMGRLDIMRQCIDLGMSADYRGWYQDYNYVVRNRLLPVVAISLLSGHVNAVRLLIERGATLDKLARRDHSAFYDDNRNLRDPLYFVRHTATLRFLLEENPQQYKTHDDSDGLFEEMLKCSVSDEVLFLALENTIFSLNSSMVCEAATRGRIDLVKKLFLMAPELSISDHEGRLVNGSPALTYIHHALNAYSPADDIHHMLQVINQATGAIPPMAFNSVTTRILRVAIASPTVSKESLVWLLTNGLVDLSIKEYQMSLHKAVHEIENYTHFSSSLVVQEKMTLLLEYDSTIALYFTIGNTSCVGKITYPHFLHILEGKLLYGRLAPEVDMEPGLLLMKMLEHGTIGLWAWVSAPNSTFDLGLYDQVGSSPRSKMYHASK